MIGVPWKSHGDPLISSGRLMLLSEAPSAFFNGFISTQPLPLLLPPLLPLDSDSRRRRRRNSSSSSRSSSRGKKLGDRPRFGKVDPPARLLPRGLPGGQRDVAQRGEGEWELPEQVREHRHDRRGAADGRRREVTGGGAGAGRELSRVTGGGGAADRVRAAVHRGGVRREHDDGGGAGGRGGQGGQGGGGRDRAVLARPGAHGHPGAHLLRRRARRRVRHLCDALRLPSPCLAASSSHRRSLQVIACLLRLRHPLFQHLTTK
ncbi:unnamed protein product [Musa textilis]